MPDNQKVSNRVKGISSIVTSFLEKIAVESAVNLKAAESQKHLVTAFSVSCQSKRFNRVKGEKNHPC